MKLYNIGVTRVAFPNGQDIGFIVNAEHADHAYQRVCDFCDTRNIAIREGHTAQRRDTNGGNEYFDRAFPLFHRID